MLPDTTDAPTSSPVQSLWRTRHLLVMSAGPGVRRRWCVADDEAVSPFGCPGDVMTDLTAFRCARMGGETGGRDGSARSGDDGGKVAVVAGEIRTREGGSQSIFILIFRDLSLMSFKFNKFNAPSFFARPQAF